MNLEQLCMGCLEEKGTATRCPRCGFVEGSGPDSPHHIPPRTMLLNKFLIGKVLGQGGFGITYLAWDLNLDLKLAIKEFFPQGLVARVPGTSNVDTYMGELKNQYEFGLERFFNEAKTLARFSEHPNVVTVRDFFKANGTAYMVMNYVEGANLQTYLASKERNRISFSQALAIFLPVLDALKEVHATGILHRDISPDNLLITTRGQAILTDFGSARQAFSEKSKSMSVIMKAGYSPEEQYRSKGMQGPWTDIYAVAATFYRTISGQLPPESLDRLADDTLIPPRQLGVAINEEQERVLLKALAIRHKERYRTVKEFQQALMQAEEAPEPIAPADKEEGAADREAGPDRAVSPDSEKTAPREETEEGAETAAPGDAGVTARSPQYGQGAGDKAHPQDEQVTAPPGKEPAAAYARAESETRPAGDAVAARGLNLKQFLGQKKAALAAAAVVVCGLAIFGVVQFTNLGTGDELSALAGELSDDEILWNEGIYDGDVVNGKPHGEGTWLHPDGREYTGEWQDGEMHGEGTMTWPDGKQYVGEWQDGARHGEGVMIWPDDYRYEGEWVAGRKHGEGEMTLPDGSVLEDEWEDGEPVSW